MNTLYTCYLEHPQFMHQGKFVANVFTTYIFNFVCVCVCVSSGWWWLVQSTSTPPHLCVKFVCFFTPQQVPSKLLHVIKAASHIKFILNSLPFREIMSVTRVAEQTLFPQNFQIIGLGRRHLEKLSQHKM